MQTQTCLYPEILFCLIYFLSIIQEPDVWGQDLFWSLKCCLSSILLCSPLFCLLSPPLFCSLSFPLICSILHLLGSPPFCFSSLLSCSFFFSSFLLLSSFLLCSALPFLSLFLCSALFSSILFSFALPHALLIFFLILFSYWSVLSCCLLLIHSILFSSSFLLLFSTIPLVSVSCFVSGAESISWHFFFYLTCFSFVASRQKKTRFNTTDKWQGLIVLSPELF